MKKYVILLFMVLVAQMGVAQNINTLFRNFKNEEGAEYVKISSFLMSIMRPFIDAETEDEQILKMVHSVKVLNLSDASAEVKSRFAAKAKKYGSGSYETLMKVKEDGDDISILVKRKKDTVREVVVIITGEEDCQLVRLKGKMKKDDITKLIKLKINS